MPSPKRYMIGPRDPVSGVAAMMEVLTALQELDGAEYVSGAADRLLVARLTPEAFRELGERYGASLIIEPDSPLSL
jgi:hypothetical protein